MDVIYLRLFNANTCLFDLQKEHCRLTKKIAEKRQAVIDLFDSHTYTGIRILHDQISTMLAKSHYIERLMSAAEPIPDDHYEHLPIPDYTSSRT